MSPTHGASVPLEDRDDLTATATPTPGPRPLIARSVDLTVALSLTGLADALGGSSTVECAAQFGPGITNHPVGVIPSAAIAVPSIWPLDNRGAITCLICHDMR